ncbi:MAG: hypothetical protein JWP35_4828, partial [Caulobacter sp.]|nr:hypothetical protein [Caulobacter sp.]
MLGRLGLDPWLAASEDEVCGLDELSHDGDSDQLGRFTA